MAHSILFLDVDGVLNSTQYWNTKGRNLPLGTAGALDPEAVARLNKIYEKTNCRIILSSSWQNYGLGQVEKDLRSRGFAGHLSGVTGEKLGAKRSAEINSWLQNHFYEWGAFVVLDDDPGAWEEGGPFNDFGYFHHTNYQIGLTDEGVDLIIRFLNS